MEGYRDAPPYPIPHKRHLTETNQAACIHACADIKFGRTHLSPVLVSRQQNRADPQYRGCSTYSTPTTTAIPSESRRFTLNILNELIRTCPLPSDELPTALPLLPTSLSHLPASCLNTSVERVDLASTCTESPLYTMSSRDPLAEATHLTAQAFTSSMLEPTAVFTPQAPPLSVPIPRPFLYGRSAPATAISTSRSTVDLSTPVLFTRDGAIPNLSASTLPASDVPQSDLSTFNASGSTPLTPSSSLPGACIPGLSLHSDDVFTRASLEVLLAVSMGCGLRIATDEGSEVELRQQQIDAEQYLSENLPSGIRESSENSWISDEFIPKERIKGGFSVFDKEDSLRRQRLRTLLRLPRSYTATSTHADIDIPVHRGNVGVATTNSYGTIHRDYAGNSRTSTPSQFAISAPSPVPLLSPQDSSAPLLQPLWPSSHTPVASVAVSPPAAPTSATPCLISTSAVPSASMTSSAVDESYVSLVSSSSSLSSPCSASSSSPSSSSSLSASDVPTALSPMPSAWASIDIDLILDAPLTAPSSLMHETTHPIVHNNMYTTTPDGALDIAHVSKDNTTPNNRGNVTHNGTHASAYNATHSTNLPSISASPPWWELVHRALSRSYSCFPVSPMSPPHLMPFPAHPHSPRIAYPRNTQNQQNPLNPLTGLSGTDRSYNASCSALKLHHAPGERSPDEEKPHWEMNSGTVSQGTGKRAREPDFATLATGAHLALGSLETEAEGLQKRFRLSALPDVTVDSAPSYVEHASSVSLPVGQEVDVAVESVAVRADDMGAHCDTSATHLTCGNAPRSGEADIHHGEDRDHARDSASNASGSRTARRSVSDTGSGRHLGKGCDHGSGCSSNRDTTSITKSDTETATKSDTGPAALTEPDSDTSTDSDTETGSSSNTDSDGSSDSDDEAVDDTLLQSLYCAPSHEIPSSQSAISTSSISSYSSSLDGSYSSSASTSSSPLSPAPSPSSISTSRCSLSPTSTATMVLYAWLLSLLPPATASPPNHPCHTHTMTPARPSHAVREETRPCGIAAASLMPSMALLLALYAPTATLARSHTSSSSSSRPSSSSSSSSIAPPSPPPLATLFHALSPAQYRRSRTFLSLFSPLGIKTPLPARNIHAVLSAVEPLLMLLAMETADKEINNIHSDGCPGGGGVEHGGSAGDHRSRRQMSKVGQGAHDMCVSEITEQQKTFSRTLSTDIRAIYAYLLSYSRKYPNIFRNFEKFRTSTRRWISRIMNLLPSSYPSPTLASSTGREASSTSVASCDSSISVPTCASPSPSSFPHAACSLCSLMHSHPPLTWLLKACVCTQHTHSFKRSKRCLAHMRLPSAEIHYYCLFSHLFTSPSLSDAITALRSAFSNAKHNPTHSLSQTLSRPQVRRQLPCASSPCHRAIRAATKASSLSSPRSHTPPSSTASSPPMTTFPTIPVADILDDDLVLFDALISPSSSSMSLPPCHPQKDTAAHDIVYGDRQRGGEIDSCAIQTSRGVLNAQKNAVHGDTPHNNVCDGMCSEVCDSIHKPAGGNTHRNVGTPRHHKPPSSEVYMEHKSGCTHTKAPYVTISPALACYLYTFLQTHLLLSRTEREQEAPLHSSSSSFTSSSSHSVSSSSTSSSTFCSSSSPSSSVTSLPSSDPQGFLVVAAARTALHFAPSSTPPLPSSSIPTQPHLPLSSAPAPTEPSIFSLSLSMRFVSDLSQHLFRAICRHITPFTSYHTLQHLSRALVSISQVLPIPPLPLYCPRSSSLPFQPHSPPTNPSLPSNADILPNPAIPSNTMSLSNVIARANSPTTTCPPPFDTNPVSPHLPPSFYFPFTAPLRVLYAIATVCNPFLGYEHVDPWLLASSLALQSCIPTHVSSSRSGGPHRSSLQTTVSRSITSLRRVASMQWETAQARAFTHDMTVSCNADNLICSSATKQQQQCRDYGHAPANASSLRGSNLPQKVSITEPLEQSSVFTTPTIRIACPFETESARMWYLELPGPCNAAAYGAKKGHLGVGGCRNGGSVICGRDACVCDRKCVEDNGSASCEENGYVADDDNNAANATRAATMGYDSIASVVLSGEHDQAEERGAAIRPRTAHHRRTDRCNVDAGVSSTRLVVCDIHPSPSPSPPHSSCIHPPRTHALPSCFLSHLLVRDGARSTYLPVPGHIGLPCCTCVDTSSMSSSSAIPPASSLPSYPFSSPSPSPSLSPPSAVSTSLSLHSSVHMHDSDTIVAPLTTERATTTSASINISTFSHSAQHTNITDSHSPRHHPHTTKHGVLAVGAVTAELSPLVFHKYKFHLAAAMRQSTSAKLAAMTTCASLPSRWPLGRLLAFSERYDRASPSLLDDVTQSAEEEAEVSVDVEALIAISASTTTPAKPSSAELWQRRMRTACRTYLIVSVILEGDVYCDDDDDQSSTSNMTTEIPSLVSVSGQEAGRGRGPAVESSQSPSSQLSTSSASPLSASTSPLSTSSPCRASSLLLLLLDPRTLEVVPLVHHALAKQPAVPLPGQRVLQMAWLPPLQWRKPGPEEDVGEGDVAAGYDDGDGNGHGVVANGVSGGARDGHVSAHSTPPRHPTDHGTYRLPAISSSPPPPLRMRDEGDAESAREGVSVGYLSLLLGDANEYASWTDVSARAAAREAFERSLRHHHGSWDAQVHSTDYHTVCSLALSFPEDPFLPPPSSLYSSPLLSSSNSPAALSSSFHRPSSSSLPTPLRTVPACPVPPTCPSSAQVHIAALPSVRLPPLIGQSLLLSWRASGGYRYMPHPITAMYSHRTVHDSSSHSSSSGPYTRRDRLTRAHTTEAVSTSIAAANAATNGMSHTDDAPSESYQPYLHLVGGYLPMLHTSTAARSSSAMYTPRQTRERAFPERVSFFSGSAFVSMGSVLGYQGTHSPSSSAYSFCSSSSSSCCSSSSFFSSSFSLNSSAHPNASPASTSTSTSTSLSFAPASIPLFPASPAIPHHMILEVDLLAAHAADVSPGTYFQQHLPLPLPAIVEQSSTSSSAALSHVLPASLSASVNTSNSTSTSTSTSASVSSADESTRVQMHIIGDSPTTPALLDDVSTDSSSTSSATPTSTSGAASTITAATASSTDFAPQFTISASDTSLGPLPTSSPASGEDMVRLAYLPLAYAHMLARSPMILPYFPLPHPLPAPNTVRMAVKPLLDHPTSVFYADLWLLSRVLQSALYWSCSVPTSSASDGTCAGEGGERVVQGNAETLLSALTHLVTNTNNQSKITVTLPRKCDLTSLLLCSASADPALAHECIVLSNAARAHAFTLFQYFTACAGTANTMSSTHGTNTHMREDCSRLSIDTSSPTRMNDELTALSALPPLIPSSTHAFSTATVSAQCSDSQPLASHLHPPSACMYGYFAVSEEAERQANLPNRVFTGHAKRYLHLEEAELVPAVVNSVAESVESPLQQSGLSDCTPIDKYASTAVSRAREETYAETSYLRLTFSASATYVPLLLSLLPAHALLPSDDAAAMHTTFPRAFQGPFVSRSLGGVHEGAHVQEMSLREWLSLLPPWLCRQLHIPPSRAFTDIHVSPLNHHTKLIGTCPETIVSDHISTSYARLGQRQPSTSPNRRNSDMICAMTAGVDATQQEERYTYTPAPMLWDTSVGVAYISGMDADAEE